MRKSTLIWLIVAASLMVAGALIFTGAMCAMNWDFSSLSTVKYLTNTYEITEDFDEILLQCSTTDVYILPSPDGVLRVECVEEEKITHNVAVDGKILHITENDTRAWYEFISIGSHETSITIYLPENTRLGVQVICSTGDVTVKNVRTSGLNLKLTTGDISITNTVLTGNIWLRGSTGDVNMENVSCKSITSTAGTGDITLEGVIAQEKFDITRTTGDVKFTACDAPEICVTVDTGDVKGSLLSGKNFTVETSTGDVRVPPSTGGGACVIKTSTGDINISVTQ